MSERTSSWLPIRHTPDLREAPLEKWIRATGYDRVGIRTELCVHHLARVNQWTSHFFSRSRLVQIHLATAYHEEIFAVPAKARGERGCVPEFDGTGDPLLE